MTKQMVIEVTFRKDDPYPWCVNETDHAGVVFTTRADAMERADKREKALRARGLEVERRPDPIATVALDLMLGVSTELPDNCIDSDGTPTFCDMCPMGKRVEPYEEVWNDLTEAHYECELLGETVWGESAPCTRRDWQNRALEELGREPKPTKGNP